MSTDNGKLHKLFDPKRIAFPPRAAEDTSEEEAAIKTEEAEAERRAVSRLSWVESGDYRHFRKWLESERKVILRGDGIDAVDVGVMKFIQAIEDKLDLDADNARELLYGS